MNPEGRDETYERACDALSALTEAALAFYVCNGCGALAPDSRQPTTKCACGTHDWRRFTRSK
jgi:hypothetical protein